MEMIKVYTFKELGAKAQEAALINYKIYAPFPFHTEYEKSLNAFCDEFPVAIGHWEVDDSGDGIIAGILIPGSRLTSLIQQASLAMSLLAGLTLPAKKFMKEIESTQQIPTPESTMDVKSGQLNLMIPSLLLKTNALGCLCISGHLLKLLLSNPKEAPNETK